MVIDGLDYKKNLVGQGYDGASVMSAKHSGLYARIKNSARFAFANPALLT